MPLKIGNYGNWEGNRPSNRPGGGYHPPAYTCYTCNEGRNPSTYWVDRVPLDPTACSEWKPPRRTPQPLLGNGPWESGLDTAGAPCCQSSIPSTSVLDSKPLK